MSLPVLPWQLFFLEENMNTAMDMLHKTWSYDPVRLLFYRTQNSRLCFCARGKKIGKLCNFFFQILENDGYSSLILLPTMCPEPKYFLFGKPGHLIQNRREKVKKNATYNSTSVKLLWSTCMYWPYLNAPFTPVLRLSSALQWKYTAKHCALHSSTHCS